MNKEKIKQILILQAVVIIYTINSIIAKLSTGTPIFDDNGQFVFKIALFYMAEVAVLGIYAICWQQMIKKFDLSVAYANRAMAVMWNTLWSIVLFHEKLSVLQWLGIVLVVVGTVVVNLDEGGVKNE